MEKPMARYDAKTSLKGQTTIPVEVRKLIGLEPGGSVQFVSTPDGEVRLVAKRRGLQTLKGLFRHSGPPVDIDEAIMDAVTARTDPNRSEVDL
jgi:AbrB family looped-hinge helix DNA binding protein